jgi:hypothetical protein
MPSPMDNQIRTLVANFTEQLATLVEGQALDRARTAVEGALGGDRRGPGRPARVVTLLPSGRPRKKAPRQLCPVPGCKNPAAPVFGMVCAKHKDITKAKIKAFREARRAKKMKSAA